MKFFCDFTQGLWGVRMHAHMQHNNDDDDDDEIKNLHTRDVTRDLISRQDQ